MYHAARSLCEPVSRSDASGLSGSGCENLLRRATGARRFCGASTAEPRKVSTDVKHEELRVDDSTKRRSTGSTRDPKRKGR
jgi:hypothetical protein